MISLKFRLVDFHFYCICRKFYPMTGEFKALFVNNLSFVDGIDLFQFESWASGKISYWRSGILSFYNINCFYLIREKKPYLVPLGPFWDSYDVPVFYSLYDFSKNEKYDYEKFEKDFFSKKYGEEFNLKDSVLYEDIGVYKYFDSVSFKKEFFKLAFVGDENFKDFGIVDRYYSSCEPKFDEFCSNAKEIINNWCFDSVVFDVVSRINFDPSDTERMNKEKRFSFSFKFLLPYPYGYIFERKNSYHLMNFEYFESLFPVGSPISNEKISSLIYSVPISDVKLDSRFSFNIRYSEFTDKDSYDVTF